jgi:valyl-tRNA synthetase
LSNVMRSKIGIKRWEPKVEEELLKIWESEGIRKDLIDPLKDEKYVIIDTPPPYPSGRWGVAQAAHYTQIDMVARALRLLGYKVFVPFYADRNGLPAEVTVEKKYGVSAHEIARTPEGREKFLKMVEEVLDEYEADMVKIWKRLGCWFEYLRNGTDSPEYRKVTQATFNEMWRKGLIYESDKPVAWCPRCGTSLSEAEIEFKKVKGKLYYIKFKVKELDDYVIIATTRPELLNGCAALIYNPSDERYKHLKGLTAVVPLYGREIPIMESEYANPDFGTGIAMMCSYGDTRDIWFFREYKLKPNILINPDGRMNANAGFLEGLKVSEAREAIAKRLAEEGLLVKTEEIEHEVPVCWRCKTPIEFIHVKEYFLKQLEFRDEILKVAEKMKFVPKEHKIKFDTWVKSLSMDWPISRTRYYGTEIPIWANNNFFGFDLHPLTSLKKLNYNIYEEGTEYSWHIDAVPADPVRDIKLTALLNLSEENYEGGELVLFRANEIICKEFNSPGSAVIFPSFINHKVNKIISGRRHTLAIWMSGPKFR